MEAVFLKLVNMSITASWLALAVIVLRLLLKRTPKFINVIMWALVGIRLVFPFSVESVLSLIPSTETFPDTFTYAAHPQINSGIDSLNTVINPVISQALAPQGLTSANPTQIFSFIASVIWIAGMIAMLLYTVISYVTIRRKVREAAFLRENIRICDRIGSPFILGIIRPLIYLPSSINEDDMEYVIAHENAHLRRRDHIWKPLGFLILTVYWFNPILWIAYILLCRDIELACDEKVIREMGSDIKKPYSNALINCSVTRRTVAACPLAFGETGVKGRIKSVLNYRKPAFWVITVAIIACIILAVTFLTDPKISNITDQSNYSQLDGISVEIASSDFSAPDPYIKIKWKNTTTHNIIYGEEFYIYYYNNGTWEDCRVSEDYYFYTIAIHLSPYSSSEHKYYLNGLIMTQPGKYRFETDCFIEDASETKFEVSVEFELSKGVDGISVHTFDPAKLVYDDGMYSYIQDAENAPTYRIVNDMQLQEIDLEGNVKECGYFEEISLTEDNFNNRFSFPDSIEGTSVEKLKKENKRAWQICRKDKEHDLYELYLLLLENDGTYYMGYGYYNMDIVGQSNSDNSHIRWLYELNETETALDNSTSTEAIGSNAYFNATVLEVYENSVLVEPFDGTNERSCSDKITVSTNVIFSDPVPILERGTEILIVYNSVIEELYPANIPTVFGIYLLSDIEK